MSSPEVLQASDADQQALQTLPQPASVVLPEGLISRKAAIQWSQALPGAALAGLVSALGIFLGPGMFGIGMLVGGFLSVALYRRKLGDAGISSGMGARLGAAAGAIGFGLFALVLSTGILLFHAGDKLRQAALQAIEQAAARNPDPRAQEMVQQLKSPEGVVLIIVLGLLFTFVFFLLLSSLGGVIGAVSLRKRRDF